MFYIESANFRETSNKSGKLLKINFMKLFNFRILLGLILYLVDVGVRLQIITVEKD